jgi:hypothetical protein
MKQGNQTENEKDEISEIFYPKRTKHKFFQYKTKWLEIESVFKCKADTWRRH